MDFSKSLTAGHKRVLHNQTVDDNGPGSILRDFEILLRFIGRKGVEASGKNNLLVNKVLPHLNSLLTRPIEIDLRRPRQKSYPYINGLYLLLRATGLATVEQAGSKQALILDNAVLESWQGLCPTERYFTLLEAWLLRGNPKILGEHIGLFSAPFLNWSDFFRRIPDEGLEIAGDREEELHVRYVPGLYIVALLDLFGLVTLQHAKPEKGEGWRIASVQRTAFGDALLHLLYQTLSLSDYLWKHEEGKDLVFGELQPAIQPFFPEWRESLAIPAQEFQDGTYVFKVSLGRVWRRISIAGKMDMNSLSFTILEAFKFDQDHLYCFTYKNRFGVPSHINHPYMEDEFPRTDEVLIGDLHLNPGATMTYLYDFGDNWEFDVKLERIYPVERELRKPLILESHGEAPEQYPSWDEAEWD